MSKHSLLVHILSLAAQTLFAITYADVVTVQSNPEFKISLLPFDIDSVVSRELKSTGLFSHAKQKLLATTLASANKEKCVVVDVGAHLGTTALYASALGFETIAIEPIPKTVTQLNASVDINEFGGRVHVVQAAATDSAHVAAKTSCMRCDRTQMSNCFLGNADQRFRRERCETVRLTTLDDVLGSSLSQHQVVCALKLTTQGFEQRVLFGARQFFARSLPCVIFVTFSPQKMEASGTPPIQLLYHLHSLGYQLFLEHNKIGPYAPAVFLSFVQEARALGEVNLVFEHENQKQCLQGRKVPGTAHLLDSTPVPLSTQTHSKYQYPREPTITNNEHGGVAPKIDAAHFGGAVPLFMQVSVPPLPTITPPPIHPSHLKVKPRSFAHVWVLVVGMVGSVLFVIRGLAVPVQRESASHTDEGAQPRLQPTNKESGNTKVIAEPSGGKAVDQSKVGS